MNKSLRRGLCAVSAALIVALPLAVLAQQPLDQQIPYGSGQNVAPVFEGWERNADGTFNLVFGYMNRNYDEQVNIPLGPNNSFSSEPADRGQPTHFYPRRQQFMFRVKVPANFGKQQLVWTLTRDGRSEKAVGKLDLEWEISQVVFSQNRGGLQRNAAAAKPNLPPKIAPDGPSQRTATVGVPITIGVAASDDGEPKVEPTSGGDSSVRAFATQGAKELPPLIGVRGASPVSQQIVKPSREGLAVTWTHWRGPGRLTFNPMRQVVKDGKSSTSVTFAEPGTYVVRAYADDGVVFEPADITFVVAAGSATSR